MRRLLEQLRRDESGYTLIELMIAMVLLVVGCLSTAAAFASSDHLNTTMQRQQAAMTAAENAMETLRATTYANLLLQTLPTQAASDGNSAKDTSKNPANPDWWVSGSNLKIVTNYSNELSGTLTGTTAAGEALVGAGGTVPPTVTLTSNGYTVTVHQYITWLNDTCTYNATNLCPNGQDAKRLTVAAIVSGAGLGVQKPVWLSTIVANPKAGQS